MLRSLYVMPRKSVKHRTVRKWKPSNPDIRNSIFQVLAQDFAKPKRASEIWDFIHEKKVCSKITLWVYLEGLKEEGLILKKSEKEKKKVTYALANADHWKELQRKYTKVMKANLKQMRKDTTTLIKRIRKGHEREAAVRGHVLYQLTAVERRQLEGITDIMLAEHKGIFWASPLIEDFIEVPYTLIIELLWECYKKYPEATLEAIGLLAKHKEGILKIGKSVEKPSG